MKYRPRPAQRGIIHLLLTACAFASVLTLAEAQTFIPVDTLEVVDVDGDKVGLFYPRPIPFEGPPSLISEGSVAFFHRGYSQGVGRVLFHLWFTPQDGFRKNGRGYYEFERCAGSPLMSKSNPSDLFVGPPGQTVYYHKPGLPVVTRTILSYRIDGICYNSNYPGPQEVVSPVPLMNLTRLFTPPFRIVARHSSCLPR